MKIRCLPCEVLLSSIPPCRACSLFAHQGHVLIAPLSHRFVFENGQGAYCRKRQQISVVLTSIFLHSNASREATLLLSLDVDMLLFWAREEPCGEPNILSGSHTKKYPPEYLA